MSSFLATIRHSSLPFTYMLSVPAASLFHRLRSLSYSASFALMTIYLLLSTFVFANDVLCTQLFSKSRNISCCCCLSHWIKTIQKCCLCSQHFHFNICYTVWPSWLHQYRWKDGRDEGGWERNIRTVGERKGGRKLGMMGVRMEDGRDGGTAGRNEGGWE